VTGSESDPMVDPKEVADDELWIGPRPLGMFDRILRYFVVAMGLAAGLLPLSPVDPLFIGGTVLAGLAGLIVSSVRTAGLYRVIGLSWLWFLLAIGIRQILTEVFILVEFVLQTLTVPIPFVLIALIPAYRRSAKARRKAEALVAARTEAEERKARAERKAQRRRESERRRIENERKKREEALLKPRAAATLAKTLDEWLVWRQELESIDITDAPKMSVYGFEDFEYFKEDHAEWESTLNGQAYSYWRSTKDRLFSALKGAERAGVIPEVPGVDRVALMSEDAKMISKYQGLVKAFLDDNPID